MVGDRSDNQAVFLDRDGVLNKIVERDGKPYPPESIEKFVLLPGVKEAVQVLREGGFRLIVVTNQPDVAKGIQTREVVEQMHRRLSEWLPLDDILVCYHQDADRCDCRKPLPGMLLSAGLKWKLDLKRSYMVGDRWRDISAGQAAGCKSIWIRNQYREQSPNSPDAVVDSLYEASHWIMQSEKSNQL